MSDIECECCGRKIERGERYINICDTTYCSECIAASCYTNTNEKQEDF